MKTPYFYIIKHLPTQKYYAGCKINSSADSTNLMTINGYQTTSKIIKGMIKDSGLESFKILKIRHFESSEEALSHEHKFLTRVNASENDRFINRHNGGKKFVNKGGYKLSESTKRKMRKPKSEETIKKQNLSKRNREKNVYEKAMQSRRDNNEFWNSPETRKKLSESNQKRWSHEENRARHSEIMKTYYSDNPVSKETREKKCENSKGDKNPMFGKTHTQDTRDKMRKAWEVRKKKGLNHRKPNQIWQHSETIKQKRSEGYTFQKIANEYGVSISVIHKIINS